MIRGLGLALLALFGKTGQAQQPEPQCAPATSPFSPDLITSDACQKAVDLFKYMFPQLGAVITSGNATPSAGSLRKRRFTLGRDRLS